MKQTTFESLAWANKGKLTRREQFLAEMDAVIPWAKLLQLIEPFYPKAGHGTQPMPMERMLRIYFMQQWFNLSDPAMEDSLYDSTSMRRFAGIELADDGVPDESTILRFRHLLERHNLTEAIFTRVRTLLGQKRLLLKSGTIVDATIIEAPTSTKNAEGERDPQMHQTKKGGGWHFGMKAHVGTDKRGIVHSLTATAANVHDLAEMPKLLHGAEREVFGDQLYWSQAHRQSAMARGIRYRINRRRANGGLTPYERHLNRIRSRTRSRGEHAFRVVKQLWGFTKVRYRGIAKNAARLFTAFALANLYLLRRRLLPPQWSVHSMAKTAW
ncbi:MAG TPA: IS5 family transposase [Steroidobacteraceae bacterium]|nr:IS5 family transposase [Steroidobacteraceae bacterium]